MRSACGHGAEPIGGLLVWMQCKDIFMFLRRWWGGLILLLLIEKIFSWAGRKFFLGREQIFYRMGVGEVFLWCREISHFETG